MRVCIYMYYVCMGSFEKIKTVRVLLPDINLIFAPTPVEHFLHRFQQGLKLNKTCFCFISLPSDQKISWVRYCLRYYVSLRCMDKPETVGANPYPYCVMSCLSKRCNSRQCIYSEWKGKWGSEWVRQGWLNIAGMDVARRKRGCPLHMLERRGTLENC